MLELGSRAPIVVVVFKCLKVRANFGADHHYYYYIYYYYYYYYYYCLKL